MTNLKPSIAKKNGLQQLLTISFLALTVVIAGCSSETDAPTGNPDTKTRPDAAAHVAVDPATLSLLKPYIERPITDDIIYFLLPDRFANGDPSNDKGGYEGGPLDHGFDPTHKGFYHGGDLKGLIGKLDYLQGMGVTAIWMAPIFKNKPVQGVEPWITAGYHGYWITDFTQIDPHFGSNADLKALVAEAHSRNMKVIFDIITNHTADVIGYEECHGGADGTLAPTVPGCPYRSKADFPYTTLGDIGGEAINQGFTGDDPASQTSENFGRLTNPKYAYSPYVKDAEKNVKIPAWMNDLKYYHNRGESTYQGENSLYGDFAGLDDLFTEHPDVVAGLTDIYKHWISEFKIDGYRIDTARHVNDRFWQQFSPALVAHAAAEGIPNFYIFGEVYDPSPKNLSHYVNIAKLPTVLDFAFTDSAARVLAGKEGTDVLAKTFSQDRFYNGGSELTSRLPTFLGNHDMGRMAMMINRAMPEASPEEKLKRVKLGHALLFFARGVPVIYSGDEQGFSGDGGDQDAREDMFPSQVDIYNDNILLGTDKTTADDNFDQSHPLYREIARLSTLYRAHPALRSGKQTEIASSATPGLYAFTRSTNDATYLVLLNSDTADINIETSRLPTGNWLRVDGGPQIKTSTLESQLAGLSFAVYKQN